MARFRSETAGFPALAAGDSTVSPRRLQTLHPMTLTRFIPACLAVLAAAHLSAAVPARPNAEQLIRSLPAWFEPNSGQFGGDVQFFSQGGSGTLLLGSDYVRFRGGDQSLRVHFLDANRNARTEGLNPTGARSSYFLGKDRRQWKAGIEQYAKVMTRQAYPGVDIVYYLNGQQLEYDFVVAPGTDPAQIHIAFAEAGRPELNEDGDLVFPNGMRQKAPAAYQQTANGLRLVEAEYRVDGKGEVRFELGRYDRHRPLIIDPVLFAGYVGGDNHERATAVAVDHNGAVWVTGSSSSTLDLFLPDVPLQSAPRGGKDLFLARFTPDGSGNLTLTYWTLLGGAQDEEATAIATDDFGFVYLSGTTVSTDFPQAGTPLQSEFGGTTDSVVVKLRPTDGLDALWYSQYYGGSERDIATSVAVDSLGSVYFAGYTTSGTLPGTDGRLQCCNRGGYEGFMVKVSPDSSSPLAYATYLGGSSTDAILQVAVESPDNVYLSGYTASDDFPITGDVYQSSMRSPFDLFLVKLDLQRPLLDALVYGTYIGGDGLDIVTAMTIDTNGMVWLAGYTYSTDFPTTAGAYRTVPPFPNGSADLFVLRFDYAQRSSPAAISYGTYLGGESDEAVEGIAVSPDGKVAVAGYTFSTDYPSVEGTRHDPLSGPDGFVSVIDPAVNGDQGLAYSAVLGGTLSDVATGVAFDPQGNLVVSGYTNSYDLPVTNGSSKTSPGAFTASFLYSIRPQAPASGGGPTSTGLSRARDGGSGLETAGGRR